ncbi:hypothetical protein K432DRAFT_409099 [Lepidopterella palustris CBS 459.81]|uniref:Uncharacterized protein n=1 Tax=Lepidopterella palustris CBS 459.81 TaxID=1314670 RepID=A0A8E2E161_9PEZI|nr:hypothetical protein K432DRAFT_409099 [Lepidopterella palustris CBS 459.81]
MKGPLRSECLPLIQSTPSTSPSPNLSPLPSPADFDYEYIFQFDDFSATPTEQASEDEEYSPPSEPVATNFVDFKQSFSDNYLCDFAQTFGDNIGEEDNFEDVYKDYTGLDTNSGAKKKSLYLDVVKDNASFPLIQNQHINSATNAGTDIPIINIGAEPQSGESETEEVTSKRVKRKAAGFLEPEQEHDQGSPQKKQKHKE